MAKVVRRVSAKGEDAQIHPDVVTERKALATAKIDAYVRQVLAEAPPLSLEQLARLASLFGSSERR